MSDRKALAREIAARTTPRFIGIRKERDWSPTVDDEKRTAKVQKPLARLLDD